MSSSPNNTTEQLKAELKSLTETLETLLASTEKGAEHDLNAIKIKAEHALKEARNTLINANEKMTEQVKEFAQHTNDYVHTKPWNSIGIAAAVGLALGILLNRR